MGRPQTSREGTAIDYFAAIEVSLELSSVCVRDGKMAGEPKALLKGVAGAGFEFHADQVRGGPAVAMAFTPVITEAGTRTKPWTQRAAGAHCSRKVALASPPNTHTRYFFKFRNHLKQFPLSSTKFAIGIRC